MFDKKIYETIFEAWKSDQGHPYKDRKNKPLPSLEDFKVLIDTSFKASLKKEENIFTTFAITLLPKNQIEEEQKYRKQLILSFDKSQPFIVETIIKLAPAFDFKNSALIIEPKKDSPSEYEIWGVMYFKNNENPFAGVPAALHNYNYFRPDTIMVTAISVGSLIISRGDAKIGRFESGNFIPASPTPFDINAMGQYILGCIKEDELFKEFDNFYYNIFIQCIDHLLSEALLRGHGSTIIIIPEKFQNNYKDKYIGRYAINQDFQLKQLFRYIAKKPGKDMDFLFQVVCNTLILGALNNLAQLSCIDGALILNTNFKPISFGAKLKSGIWNGKTLLGQNGSYPGGEIFPTSNLGTRHSSAINFVGESEQIIAFVISQDGPVRGFIKKDRDTILCWPDCRLSMFI